MNIASKLGGALALTWVMGCGSNVTSASPDAAVTIDEPVAPDTGPSSETVCAARAQAECARRDACSDNFLIARTFGDMATCVSRLSALCVLTLAAADTSVTPARVSACAAAYPSIACADFLNGNLPEVCLALAGHRPVGAPCQFASQCASTYCAITTGSQCGVCAPPPAANDLCNGSSAPQGCGGRGLVCIGENNGAPGICAQLVAQGGACDAMRPCGSGLSCTPLAVTAMNRTCQPSGATVGAPCGGTNPGCDNERGLACNAMSRTCQRVALVDAPSSCGLGTDASFTACNAAGDCMGSTPAAPRGVCRAAAADGSPCDRATGPFCRTPSLCVTTGTITSGTCRPPSAASCG